MLEALLLTGAAFCAYLLARPYWITWRWERFIERADPDETSPVYAGAPDVRDLLPSREALRVGGQTVQREALPGLRIAEEIRRGEWRIRDHAIEKGRIVIWVGTGGPHPWRPIEDVTFFSHQERKAIRGAVEERRRHEAMKMFANR